MDWTLAAKIVAVAWAAIGPLVGVLIGAFLTSRIQRRQWLSDRKREEYHELLSTITAAYQEMMLLKNTDNLSMEDYNRLNFTVHNAVQNCIFASDSVIMKVDVFGEWVKSVRNVKGDDFNKIEFGKKMGSLLEDIRQLALKDIRS
ncbi:MAG: hypothetical protein JWN74_2018 [Acidobacteriaceae bacterium]|jgi:hypothetical protein|nr:hypothetical protein [Acidobacteriaceae bacterium]